MNPPPNESTAKRADRLATMGRPRGDSGLQRKERPDFSRPDRHVPDDAGQDRCPPVPRAEEEGTRRDVGEGEEDERLPPADTIREEADDERVQRAAQDGRGQDDPDGDGSEAQLGQVDAKDDPEETVRDRSDRLLEEDELPVSIDPVSEAHNPHRAEHRASNAAVGEDVKIYIDVPPAWWSDLGGLR